MRNPPIVSAHVERARGFDAFDATLELGFDVVLRRQVRMRRSDPLINVPAGRMGDANHCLVILIGGKDVTLVEAKEERGVVTASVFLTHSGTELPAVDVPGLAGRFIDVYEALRWADAQGWNPKVVREALK